MYLLALRRSVNSGLAGPCGPSLCDAGHPSPDRQTQNGSHKGSRFPFGGWGGIQRFLPPLTDPHFRQFVFFRGYINGYTRLEASDFWIRTRDSPPALRPYHISPMAMI